MALANAQAIADNLAKAAGALAIAAAALAATALALGWIPGLGPALVSAAITAAASATAAAALAAGAGVAALLGVTTMVRRFDDLLALADQHPRVREWVVDHPHRALELGPEMPQLIAAYVWLDSHRQSQRYLREISAPGVDTKFAERHRTGPGRDAWRFIDSLGIPGRSWSQVASPDWFGCGPRPHWVSRLR